MNPSSASADSGSGTAGASYWLWALLAALICCAAVSRQSLWIDEALTATKAAAPNVTAWWAAMRFDKASDLQMPLYMAYIWGFAKLFGTSEIALRLANLPWFAGGIGVFVAAVGGRKKISLALVALFSPFAWYYLDEARPYAMQIGTSMVIFAALFRLRQNGLTPVQEQRWIAALFFGIIFLCGSSLLGMIWAGAAVLSLPALFSWRRLAELFRANQLAVATLTVTMATAAFYYLWTMKLGARASDVGRTDASNVAFIVYELLGFAGLGPGRLEIRDTGLKAFTPFAIALAAYGIVVVSVIGLGVWQLLRRLPRKTLIGLALAIAAPLVVILAAGFIMHFRVVGRHCAPLLPVVIVIFWLGLDAQWSRPGALAKIFALGFVGFCVASCMSLRFSARHAKDDYRSAAAAATAALESGRSVWWNAAREGAIYYQVPLTDVPMGKTRAIWIMNPTAEALALLPTPDVVITSKPDVFDGAGAVEHYLRQGRYLKHGAYQAFTVWERPGDVAQSPSYLREGRLAANLIE